MSNRLERVRQRGAATRRVARMLVDGLGRRLDPGITELVVALRLHGFRTTARARRSGPIRCLVPRGEVASRLSEATVGVGEPGQAIRSNPQELGWGLGDGLTLVAAHRRR